MSITTQSVRGDGRVLSPAGEVKEEIAKAIYNARPWSRRFQRVAWEEIPHRERLEFYSAADSVMESSWYFALSVTGCTPAKDESR